MPITFELPDSITIKDRKQIERVVDIAMRNAKILEEYPDMLKEYGSERAIYKLGRKYKCSVQTVYNVIYRYNKK